MRQKILLKCFISFLDFRFLVIIIFLRQSTFPHTASLAEIQASDYTSLFQCTECSRNFQSADELYQHQNEQQHIQTNTQKTIEGYFCWFKNCGLGPYKEATQLQQHFFSTHVTVAHKLIACGKLKLQKQAPLTSQKFDEGLVFCEDCDAVFENETSLRKHSVIHIIREIYREMWKKAMGCGEDGRKDGNDMSLEFKENIDEENKEGLVRKFFDNISSILIHRSKEIFKTKIILSKLSNLFAFITNVKINPPEKFEHNTLKNNNDVSDAFCNNAIQHTSSSKGLFIDRISVNVDDSELSRNNIECRSGNKSFNGETAFEDKNQNDKFEIIKHHEKTKNIEDGENFEYRNTKTHNLEHTKYENVEKEAFNGNINTSSFNEGEDNKSDNDENTGIKYNHENKPIKTNYSSVMNYNTEIIPQNNRISSNKSAFKRLEDEEEEEVERGEKTKYTMYVEGLCEVNREEPSGKSGNEVLDGHKTLACNNKTNDGENEDFDEKNGNFIENDKNEKKRENKKEGNYNTTKSYNEESYNSEGNIKFNNGVQNGSFCDAQTTPNYCNDDVDNYFKNSNFDWYNASTYKNVNAKQLNDLAKNDFNKQNNQLYKNNNFSYNSNQHLMMLLSRQRSSYYKSLLENVGFECAMLFNETAASKQCKNNADENSNSNKSREQNDSNSNNNNSNTHSNGSDDAWKTGGDNNEDNNNNDDDKNKYNNNPLPEMAHSKCRFCDKEFSSVWVLKAHEEDQHGCCVPLEAVEKFAEAFRKHYEQRQANNLNGYNMENEDRKLSESDTENTSPKSTSSSQFKNSAKQLSGKYPFFHPALTPFKNHDPQSSSHQSREMTAFQMEFLKQMSMMMMMPGGLDSNSSNTNPFFMQFPMMFPFGFNPELIALGNNLFDPKQQLHNQMLMSNMFSFNQQASNSNNKNNNMSLQQQQQQQFIQQQLQQQQQQKRARTRITDEQLSILRAHFDISNSPSDEQIAEMALSTQLPPKVIKHWFRNTLFKERQRSKDSPYNFNNPPTTVLYPTDNDDDATDSGECKNTSENDKKDDEKINEKDEKLSNAESESKETSENAKKTNEDENDDDRTNKESNEEQKSDTNETIKEENNVNFNSKKVKMESILFNENQSSGARDLDLRNISPLTSMGNLPPQMFPSLNIPRLGPPPFFLPPSHPSMFSSNTGLTFPTGPGGLPLFPQPSYSSHSFHHQSQSQQQPSTNHGKRANRTHFTDQQIKILQEHFEINAYPKDEELEMLSGLLDLSPRVIIVWFQNARQKARKSYENQPQNNANNFANNGSDGDNGGHTFKYQCQFCSVSFERYYELIKHQRLQCRKNNSVKNFVNTHNADLKLKEQDKNTNQLTDEKSRGNNFKMDYENAFKRSFEMNQLPNLASSQTKRVSNNEYQGDDNEDKDSVSDRRMRTVIMPHQLDILNRKFREDSNPSRKQLRTITAEVGLSKRVVQVWFQNVRAREKKGPSGFSNKLGPLAKNSLESNNDDKSYIPPDKRFKIDTENKLSSSSSSSSSSSANAPKTPSFNFNQLMHNPSNIPHPFLPFFNSMNLLYSGGDVVNKFNAKADDEGKHELPLDLSKPLSTQQDSNLDFSLRKRRQHFSNSSLNNSFNNMDNDSVSQSDNDNDSLAVSSCKEDDFNSSFKKYPSFDKSPVVSSNSSRLCNSVFPTFVPKASSNDSQQAPSTSGKRHRTHMTSVQIRVMKMIYSEYKTPTITECDILGREIGLRKRVVQVWFQNARAKDKKSRLADGLDGELPSMQSPAASECKVCLVVYNNHHSVRDHLFSSEHIENVKRFVKTQSDSESTSSQQAFMGEHSSGRFSSFPASTQSTYPPLLPSNTDLMPGLVAHELMAKLHQDSKEADNCEL